MESRLIDRWRRWKVSGIPLDVRIAWAASDVLHAHWALVALMACAIVLVLGLVAVLHAIGR